MTTSSLLRGTKDVLQTLTQEKVELRRRSQRYVDHPQGQAAGQGLQFDGVFGGGQQPGCPAGGCSGTDFAEQFGAVVDMIGQVERAAGDQSHGADGIAEPVRVGDAAKGEAGASLVGGVI